MESEATKREGVLFQERSEADQRIKIVWLLKIIISEVDHRWLGNLSFPGLSAM